MSGLFIKLLLFVVLAGIVFFGVRRIWRDWKGQFRKLDEAEHKRVRERDLAERARTDVITLKRGKDGTFRPGDDR
jgi:hypothetical protein